eukprot:SAG11_NODE_2028_length_3906_cov_1.458892_1_plen_106_part_10
MCAEMHLDPDSNESRAHVLAGGYLDDVGIVAPPTIARLGYETFVAECARVGWTVNAQKTVVSSGFYLTGDDRAQAVAAAAAAFQTAAEGGVDMMEPDGLVFLGCPL